MTDPHDWHELIDRHLRGELSETEKERLAERLDRDPEARKDFVDQVRWDTRLTDVLREAESDDRAVAVLSDRSATGLIGTPILTVTSALLTVAAMIIIALTASLYFRPPSGEQKIAKITGLSGSLQWTGDGGRVVDDLAVGTELAGGTVEGMTPGSWFELEFIDGSTVTISGNSMLTLSDHGQKELHLKEGNLSGNIKPQPTGRPMLIYTRSAILEILGTQFEVEAALAATMLNVSEGEVRVTRLSDGSTVDVPAKHRVIAAADQDMLPVLVPDSVTWWNSQLYLGPDGTYGNWLPESDEGAAKLGAVPYTTRRGQTIYTASFGVSRGDKPPVILRPDSRFRVVGHIRSPHKVYFGVTVRHGNGKFAGNFQTIRPAAEFSNQEDFEATLHLRDFWLDPSLVKMKDKLPAVPFQLVVESIWCHTLDKPSGLEITEVELLSPSEDASEK